jgi:putative transposase
MQEVILRQHCEHARFVWNLCVEQQSWYRPGRSYPPRLAQQCRQLAEARSEFAWLRIGSSVVQQQALADFAKAMDGFFRGTHQIPTWRKAGRDEGFRVVDAQKRPARRLSRKVGEAWIPKTGWVRFRWSRTVPEAKSYRVMCDRAGRWHIAFAAIPAAIHGPQTGDVVGIDRGVAVSAALSTGELLRCPGLREAERARLLRLHRKLARAERGSNRRGLVKLAIAKLRARETDRRKDWAEKVSTDLARRFDVIRVEDLKIKNMTRSARGTVEEPGRNVRAKSALNREILASGWGVLVRRLEDKAPDRVEKIRPNYTSMTCNACGHCERGNRESQAFLCLHCGHADHADTNAAKNIALGHRVNARRADRVTGAVKREPQAAA